MRPLRRFAKKVARRASRVARRLMAAERPIVLMYHRVESIGPDPWDLAVSPKNFDSQIELLGRSRTILPLSELAAELAAGRLPKHVAAVTFDDGYVDLHRHAVPILEAHRCPGTVFITSGSMGRTDIYWWDLLSRAVLEAPGVKGRIGVPVGTTTHTFDAGTGSPAERDALLARLHRLIKPLRAEDRQAALAALVRAVDADPETPDRDRPMTVEEMKVLAASAVVEIGGHTVTHPSLPTLPDDALATELAASRESCREWTGQPVDGFAYPYGDHDDRVVRAARAAGYHHAVTTEPLWVRPGTDPMRIPRLLVADWDADSFRREILAHG
jgi:peptidoglycan/xylan/chitin deacetylase (PgdA/CDA1 family)